MGWVEGWVEFFCVVGEVALVIPLPKATSRPSLLLLKIRPLALITSLQPHRIEEEVVFLKCF